MARPAYVPCPSSPFPPAPLPSRSPLICTTSLSRRAPFLRLQAVTWCVMTSLSIRVVPTPVAVPGRAPLETG